MQAPPSNGAGQAPSPEPCLGVCLVSVSLLLSLRKDWSRACSCPSSHPRDAQVHLSASVLLQTWGSLLSLSIRENLEDPVPLPQGGKLWTQASSAQPRVPRSMGPQVPLPDQAPLSSPFSPSPSSPRAFLASAPLHTLCSSYCASPVPPTSPFLAPLLPLPVPEPPQHARPELSTSITSSVTSSPGERQGQPPFTDEETEAREASDCPRSLHQLRVQGLEPTTAYLGSPYLSWVLSNSLPGLLPTGLTTPWISAGRHVLSAAFHPKLPGSLSSAHAAPRRMGILPATGLGLT